MSRPQLRRLAALTVSLTHSLCLCDGDALMVMIRKKISSHELVVEMRSGEGISHLLLQARGCFRTPHALPFVLCFCVQANQSKASVSEVLVAARLLALSRNWQYVVVTCWVVACPSRRAKIGVQAQARGEKV